jgi:two-component system CheB/CheR fusion protein
MRVSQVGDPETLQPNHVYVIPPDRQLHVTDNMISTAEFDVPRGRRAPIDLFFRSLAEEHGDGFAIILSGAGADGAIGVKDVKEGAASFWCRTPPKPSIPRCRAARSRPESRTSCCRYASSPPVYRG